jgi:hypothetical protein
MTTTGRPGIKAGGLSEVWRLLDIGYTIGCTTAQSPWDIQSHRGCEPEGEKNW